MEKTTGVRFDNVAGVDEAKAELLAALPKQGSMHGGRFSALDITSICQSIGSG